MENKNKIFLLSLPKHPIIPIFGKVLTDSHEIQFGVVT